MKKIVSLFIVLAMSLSCSAAFAADSEYSDIGPYFFEPGIERAKVVVEAQKTDVPAELSDKVIQVYPPYVDEEGNVGEGRFKAWMFSSDDGPAPNERDFIVPELASHNMVGVLNVFYGPNQHKNYIKAMADQGMEIASHTYSHRNFQSMNKDTVKYEVGEGKRMIERLSQKEIVGLVSPGSDHAAVTDRPTGEWFNNYLKYTGHRYMKQYQANLKPWEAKTAEELDVSIPTNFFDWLPTSEFNDGLAVTPDVSTDYYVNERPDNNTLTLLYYNTHGGWSHFDEGKSSRTMLSECCDIVSSNFATVWNPTPAQYVDYMNALWNTTATLSEDAEGKITAKNTSGEITVWLKIYGTDIEIPAGKAVTVDASGSVINTENVQMVYGFSMSRYDLEPLNPLTLVEGNTVNVEGTLDSALAGSEVALYMVPFAADEDNLTEADLKYFYQEEVQVDGTYSFRFPCDDIEFDENGISTNYKILVNHAGKDVTPSVTEASMDRTVQKFNWDISKDGDIATAVMSIDNSIGNTGNYTMILASYSADNELLGVTFSDLREMAVGLMEEKLSVELPEGAAKITGFLFDSTEKLIPLTGEESMQIAE